MRHCFCNFPRIHFIRSNEHFSICEFIQQTFETIYTHTHKSTWFLSSMKWRQWPHGQCDMLCIISALKQLSTGNRYALLATDDKGKNVLMLFSANFEVTNPSGKKIYFGKKVAVSLADILCIKISKHITCSLCWFIKSRT